VQISTGEIVNLGVWLGAQRTNYSEGRLSEEKIRKLESIGITWKLRLKWEESYELAKKYYQENGNLYINQDVEVILENGVKYPLGRWISTQRQKNADHLLEKDKVELLDKIGMEWSVILKWDDYYEIAKDYYNKNGNLILKQDFCIKEENHVIKLGSWIQYMRTLYRLHQLSDEKIKKLENIGMKWSLVLTWEDYYELAKEYYNMKGNLKGITSYNVTMPDEKIVRVGRWIGHQREKYRDGLLEQDRIKLLENIGMIWELKKGKSKDDSKSLCKEYALDCEKYPDLLKIPYEVLSAKINYLNSNNVSLMNNNVLNPIFFMSDVNMQVMYGISLEDLVKQYSNSNKKGGK